MNSNNNNNKKKAKTLEEAIANKEKKQQIITEGVNKSHHKSSFNFDPKNIANNCGPLEVVAPAKIPWESDTYKLQMFDNYGDGWQTITSNYAVGSGLQVTKTYNDGTVENEEYAMCSQWGTYAFDCTSTNDGYYAEQTFNVSPGIEDVSFYFPGDQYGEIGLIIRGPQGEVLFSSGTVNGNNGNYNDLNSNGFGTLSAGPLETVLGYSETETVCICSTNNFDCEGNCSELPCQIKQNKDVKNLIKNTILALPLIPLGIKLFDFLKSRREKKRIEEANTHTHNLDQHDENTHSHPHDSNHDKE